MSCVVAVARGDVIWMGADSAASDGEDIVVLQNPKVFINGPLLIGAVGSLRMTQLLQHRLEVPKPDWGSDKHIMRYMTVDLVDAIRKAFGAGGYTVTQEDPASGGIFLAGIQGRIFRFENDLQVFERKGGYEAVGCGSPYALGALATLPVMHAKEKVRMALAVSASFAAHVRPPYLIMSSEGESQHYES
jgi:ATP-dependent protease HslVU (ClpYQ) peptidase subunit